MGGVAVSGADVRNRRSAVRYHVGIGARVVRVEVDGDAAWVEGAGDRARVLDGGCERSLRLVVGDRPHRVFGVRVGEDEWEIQYRGRSFRVEVADGRGRRVRRARGGGAARAAAGLEPLRAPMPGLVVRVDVRAGQEVAKGQGLLIVEAMKMENELRAGAAGRVRRVRVSAGESVRRGDVLVEFAPAAAAGPSPDGDGSSATSPHASAPEGTRAGREGPPDNPDARSTP